MKKMMLCAVVALTLVACGDKSSSTGGDSTAGTSTSSTKTAPTTAATATATAAAKGKSEMVKLNDDYADKVCACKDKECAAKVTTDFGARMASATTPTDPDEMSALAAATKRASAS
jgi:hypothetical protein